MRHRPITNHLADILNIRIFLAKVADVPVGSLVVQLSDYERAWVGEITEHSLEDPRFAEYGVTWIGLPRVGPEFAYIATPEFRRVINTYTRFLEQAYDEAYIVGEGKGMHPGDLVAMRWFDDPTWYINFLEVAESEIGEPTLGFWTLPGSYGTLDTADELVQISAGHKEWSPRPRG